MITRPVFRRMLAEDVHLRTLIIHLMKLYKSRGITKKRICEEARVNYSSLEMYIKQDYVEFICDPQWKREDGSRWRAYIGDEGLLRIAEYFGIKVELNIVYDPMLYDRIEERLKEKPGWSYIQNYGNPPNP